MAARLSSRRRPSATRRAAQALNVVKEVVTGKRIIVVDDSIVRGTTTRAKMAQLRRAGAKEIHLRISCPPIRHPCYFGIDFPGFVQAHRRQPDRGGDQGFPRRDSSSYHCCWRGMLACVSRAPENYCTACFSGKYRLNIEKPEQAGFGAVSVEDVHVRRSRLSVTSPSNSPPPATQPLLPLLRLFLLRGQVRVQFSHGVLRNPEPALPRSSRSSRLRPHPTPPPGKLRYSSFLLHGVSISIFNPGLLIDLSSR